MVVPFAIAGVLMVLAVGVHVFVGTRETLALRPTENRPTADVAVSTPSTRGELTRHWAQTMCVFQLVSVDLLLVTIAALLLAFTDVLPAKRDIGLFIAAYLGAWGVVWLGQLTAGPALAGWARIGSGRPGTRRAPPRGGMVRPAGGP